VSTDIQARKDDHLDLCATDRVAFRERSTLLEEVSLVHDSLPELALDQLDTSVELLGKRLRAPIVIASMTGGTERAGAINRALAALAERRGYGFGLGSQRAMQKRPESAGTFRVREVAPTALVIGNLGVVQAREQPTDAIRALIDEVGADALFLHMNPAQELIQPGGDRDFRGGLATFERLVRELGKPVVAKETGCGIGRRVAERLRAVGVTACDVSGAGGTSWVAVETLRAEGAQRALGERFWDWGVPTAVSVVWARRAGLVPIATGGIQSGLDVARALALGARAAGIARPALRAFEAGGEAGAEAFFDQLEAELRTAMLLTGCRRAAELAETPRVLGPGLERWLAAG
jgi:isopentenyl-diphosphate delta-isomerase